MDVAAADSSSLYSIFASPQQLFWQRGANTRGHISLRSSLPKESECFIIITCMHNNSESAYIHTWERARARAEKKASCFHLKIKIHVYTEFNCE
jgi:hypothetical protein